jgi:hypothetical protein
VGHGDDAPKDSWRARVRARHANLRRRKAHALQDERIEQELARLKSLMRERQLIHEQNEREQLEYEREVQAYNDHQQMEYEREAQAYNDRQQMAYERPNGYAQH